jgi:hypothetical protein
MLAGKYRHLKVRIIFDNIKSQADYANSIAFQPMIVAYEIKESKRIIHKFNKIWPCR